MAVEGADQTFPSSDGEVEKPEDFGDNPAGIVERYLTEIKIYDRGVKVWVEAVQKIENRYRNKWPTPDTVTRRKYALLWSTIQTQTPALFSHNPTPVVERRWKDVEDETANVSAQVLDRALTYVLDQGDFYPSVHGAVFDYQISGRGVVWLRKEVDTGDEMEGPASSDESADPNPLDDETNSDLTNDEVVREVLDERICVDQVPWTDFGHTLARNWKEVTIVWRKLYMNRQQLIARFGATIGNKVTLDFAPDRLAPDDAKNSIPPHLYMLATVYEVWDKTTKKVLWVALGYQAEPLDEKDDPLHIHGFFPCPRPIYSSPDTTSLVPLPDYTMWEDQAREVDELTERLHRLIKACKVRGAYNSRFAELAQLFDETLELDMTPITAWEEFAQKGGLSGALDFVPLEPVIKAVSELYQAREQAKRDASEINGVGDILRGQNAGPEQTATQARITGQFGTLRLQQRQKDIQRFCRDIVRMMGEMIAEGFLPETLEQMTGIQLPTALEKQAAQGLVDQDKAYQQWKASQPPPTAAPPAASMAAPHAMAA